MYIVYIDGDRCTGCGECAANCPVQLLAVADKTCEVVGDPSECMGCESCTALCESGAVTIQEI